MSTVTQAPSNANRICFVVSTLLTLFLYLAPIPSAFSYPFVWLSTLAHEMGHGLASLMIGGTFESFEMWSDGSGIARTTGGSTRISSAFVSAGGLVGPAIAAMACFFFARTETRARVGAYLFGFIAIFTTAMVVRNLFGIVFVLALALTSLAFAHKAPSWVTQAWVTLIGVQLGLSVFSRGDYLFTETAVTGGGTLRSDTGQMADALFLPYWFWGIVCGGFSIMALLIGLKLIWGRDQVSLPPAPPASLPPV